MHWSAHVVADPTVLAGTPVVRGTRLGVDFLLGLLAAGWTPEQVLAGYPRSHPRRFAPYSPSPRR